MFKKIVFGFSMPETMNVTLLVASLFDCDHLSNYANSSQKHHPIWRQTIIGCGVLQILRDMYGFNVNFVPEEFGPNVTAIGRTRVIDKLHDQSVDIYLRPMSLGITYLDNMYPMNAAYMWSYGFILRRPDDIGYRTFYSKPFSRPVWNCLYVMAFMVSLIFYGLKKWELRILKGWECSYSYEILMIIGAYCQHIPPIEAQLPSRRISYIVFLMFAYTVYTFYTSNLLSHLVNDENVGMTLKNLAETDLEIVIVDYMVLTVNENVPVHKKYLTVVEKLRGLRSVSISEGLNGVKAGTMALLSDYMSLFPFIRTSFTTQEICDTINIDLFTHITKYFFTSKDFLYKEQFKIGILRAKETGILKRLMSNEYKQLECAVTKSVETKLLQISTPLAVLSSTYVMSVLILICERIYYKRTKVWPYVE